MAGDEAEKMGWAQKTSLLVMLVVKDPLAKARDPRDADSISGLGRSPGVRNGNPLKCSCVRNPMDREARWVTVHGVTKSQTQLTTHNIVNFKTGKINF